MADSQLLAEKGEGQCSSSAGGYYLSKAFLDVQVLQATDKKVAVAVAVKPKGDRSRGYCLDFLASATSDDTFVVQKDTDNQQLLVKLTSDADDKSQQIALNIVQTVFTAASGSPTAFRSLNEVPQGATRLFGAEYDPFNKSQTALVNEGLKDFGFCLVLEGERYDSRFRSVDEYCNNPTKYIRREAALSAASQYRGEGAFVNSTKGIFYKPRLPYNLFLFKKQDGTKSGSRSWRLEQSQVAYLENKSPTLVIGVDRTFFARRKTTLTFTMGVLQDVDVDKESELKNFVQIPMTVANDVAQLPAQIVQVKINQSSKQAELIRAQDQLISAQRQLQADRASLAPVPPVQRSATDSSADQTLPQQNAQDITAPKPASSCIAECLSKSGGSTIEACQKSCVAP